jgi:S1-C subfamily serine protease
MKQFFSSFASGWFARMAFVLLACGWLTPVSAATRNAFAWEKSVVNIEINRKQYDYFQPWTQRQRTLGKSCVVIAPKEILTTAEELSDLALVRAQRDGRGKWWNAKLVWIDYHANLALLTVEDEAFWTGLKPVTLMKGAPDKDKLQAVRWRNGNLEVRKVELNQFVVEEARLSSISHVQLELDSTGNNLGWPECVIQENRMAALTCGPVGTTMRAIPATLIQAVLQARTKPRWQGLGSFPFLWQQTENTATLSFLKLPGEPRGVVVIDAPATKGEGDNLRQHDIILQVDGFNVDMQGFYADPDYGRLLIENLANRTKFAGEKLVIKVWREGREQSINYQLPRITYSKKLVPAQVFDVEPQYLVVGGLIFQPLTEPYLRGFGAEWRRVAPFRLTYYTQESVKPGRTGLVVLSGVLPDLYNLGYQDARNLVLDKVNGRKINTLLDLREALRKPEGRFHTLEYEQSDSLRRMVVDAEEETAATRRVLQRYGIPQASNISPLSQP